MNFLLNNVNGPHYGERKILILTCIYTQIHTQERRHIALLNCQHFHFAVIRLTGEESQLPPSK